MKILVLGGKGMAGHMVVDYLSSETQHEISYTARGEHLASENAYPLDVMNSKEVQSLLNKLNPDIVINCVGLLNDNATNRQMESIYINGLFPHLLAKYGDEIGFKLIHISTDCVFSGKKGDYREGDETDGATIYAKTKSLGEVVQGDHLTIRTSIIGPEKKLDGIGLFHWFMQQKGEIQGYRKVYWSGVTTLELAKAIHWTIETNVNGLVHLTAPRKISKFELLGLLKTVFNRQDVVITPYDGKMSDKSLTNTREDFSYPVPDYREMLEELKTWMETKGKGEYHYA